MRKIVKIALSELRTLFCSPVAWLILIIFTVQVGMQYMTLIETMLQQQFGRPLWYSIARVLLTDTFGLYAHMLPHLYLYIPLLTMGLMSREYSSGSIKLLYSSPVRGSQIILGKYLSMLLYNLIFIAIFFVFIGFTMLHVPHFDLSIALAGALGVYLVIAVYAAIGLFMSCLTAYQVVAAVATLGALAFLNYVGGLGQDIPFVRDVTYWLSIRGRADELTGGLICSEDVLYFLLVIALFLVLSVMKLQAGKKRRTRGETAVRYGGVVVFTVFLGFLTTMPAFKWYYDATATKKNTLAEVSQEVMKQMKGDLTITTYVNLFDHHRYKGMPDERNRDKEKFEQYIRFKPDLKMKYVYYYSDEVVGEELKERFPGLTPKEMAWKLALSDDVDVELFRPYAELKDQVDLAPEGFRFVRLIERGNGRKTFLRLFDDPSVDPKENEISTAMKRLIVDKVPKVGFISGYGQRDIRRAGDRDYYTFANSPTFRHSLINKGFDVESLTLMREIPSDVDILVIADINTALSPEALERVNRYVERGGNLIIAGEPGKAAWMNPLLEPLGVQLQQGELVQPSGAYDDNLLLCSFTEKGVGVIPGFQGAYSQRYGITMPGAAALGYTEEKGFRVTPVLTTSGKGSWNELDTRNFIDEKATLNPNRGEQEGAYATLLALTRNAGGREQRIAVLGDADCISNAELLMRRQGVRNSNFSLITGMFRWMSYDEFPLAVTRPSFPDKVLELKKESLPMIEVGLMWIFPALFAAGGVGVWLKRRRR